jgi:hypothetical protein
MSALDLAATVATCVLAAAAIAAFGANVYQARQTRKAVDAAVAETTAVETQTAALLRQAKATEMLAEEAEGTRKIEWQPLLNWDHQAGRIWNTGRGHAYRVIVADGRNRSELAVSQSIPVGASSSNAPPATGWLRPHVARTVILPDHAEWGVFCEDQFGNQYRFLDKGARPDVWRVGEERSTIMWLQVWWLADPMTTPAAGG